jgi:hypothetical protein
MIEKITQEEFIEEVYSDQLQLIKSLELTPKERVDRKEKVKEFILESESIDDLLNGLEKIGYSSDDIFQYILSFFIEE